MAIKGQPGRFKTGCTDHLGIYHQLPCRRIARQLYHLVIRIIRLVKHTRKAIREDALENFQLFLLLGVHFSLALVCALGLFIRFITLSWSSGVGRLLAAEPTRRYIFIIHGTVHLCTVWATITPDTRLDRLQVLVAGAHHDRGRCDERYDSVASSTLSLHLDHGAKALGRERVGRGYCLGHRSREGGSRLSDGHGGAGERRDRDRNIRRKYRRRYNNRSGRQHHRGASGIRSSTTGTNISGRCRP